MNNQQQLAFDDVALLVSSNRELSLDKNDILVYQGATNNIFSGRYKGQAVVFKRFVNRVRKKQEETALRLFANTGYVPQLFSIINDKILVMQKFTGLPFYQVEDNVSFAQWKGLFHQLGTALEKVVAVAPGGTKNSSILHETTPELDADYHFYCTADLETFFDTVTECSARVLTDSDIPHKAILARSLSRIRSNRQTLLSFPQFIYMDDFHYANIIADGPQLKGFIDLEMTRYGNEILVLANVLASMIPQQPERWSWIRQGYEAGRGEALDSDLISLAAIFAPFTLWIRFMWYWTTDEITGSKKKMRAVAIEDLRKTVELMDAMTLGV